MPTGLAISSHAPAGDNLLHLAGLGSEERPGNYACISYHGVIKNGQTSLALTTGHDMQVNHLSVIV